MLKFKSVEIKDIPVLNSYLRNSSITCDRTSVNLFCWQHFYRTEWTEYNNWLIIRAFINGERRAAYIPVSKNSTPNYHEIIPILLENASLCNETLTLMGLNKNECDILEKNFKNQFIFDNNRDFADYIYLVEDLKSLKGRKYSQKRNHVNKFKSLYNYRYEPIDKNNIKDCLELEDFWINQHNGDEGAVSENQVIKKAFQNFETLGLLGGALYVDDKLVAFTYGSAINNEMFCTHVEKADINYNGVYQMINHLFAQHIPDNFIYLNREEDMGLKGLRKSKMSYEPYKLNYKTTALFKNQDMNDIINIWKQCFGEDDDYVYPFLSRYYFEHCSFTKRIDGHIIAMLFVIPCETSIGMAAYIYGVATLPEHQYKGYSSEIMQDFISKCKNEKYDFAFLIAEDTNLEKYYEKFGFSKTKTNVIFNSDLNLGTGEPSKDLAMILPMNDNFNVLNYSESIECKPIL